MDKNGVIRHCVFTKVILVQLVIFDSSFLCVLCVLCVEDFNAKDAENSQRMQRRFLEVPCRGNFALGFFPDFLYDSPA